jgi:hypothetical protein
MQAACQIDLVSPAPAQRRRVFTGSTRMERTDDRRADYRKSSDLLRIWTLEEGEICEIDGASA